MNKYLIVVEKIKDDITQWWGYKIDADGIEEVMSTIEGSPDIWSDCDAWEVISVHKQWKIGGQMVNEVRLGRLL